MTKTQVKNGHKASNNYKFYRKIALLMNQNKLLIVLPKNKRIRVISSRTKILTLNKY